MQGKLAQAAAVLVRAVKWSPFVLILGFAFGQGDPHLFDYDAAAPTGYKETLVRTTEGVSVFDASYTSPKGGRVSCYVVSPAKGKGKFAGIVWQHGGGQDRQWFLPDAVELAKSGAVSILLDAPFNRPQEMRVKFSEDDVEQQRQAFIQVAVDARRALDVLAARPDIDKDRIGYGGLSFGAMMGATVAGIDPRFKAFVLMVGLEGFARHYRESPAPAIVQMREKMGKEELERLIKAVQPIDNINYIGKHTAPLLFQAARFDEGVPAEHTYAFYEAAGEQKELQWYDSGHMLNDRRAAEDRINWLKKQLKIR